MNSRIVDGTVLGVLAIIVLCGMTFDLMPDWFKLVARIKPLSYVVGPRERCSPLGTTIPSGAHMAPKAGTVGRGKEI